MIEFIPHLADICLRIRGKTLEELFRNALAGMSQIQIGENKSDGHVSRKRKISISATNNTDLLIDFLSEVLSFSYIDKAVYSHTKELTIQNSKLEVVLHGKQIKELDRQLEYFKSDEYKNRLKQDAKELKAWRKQIHKKYGLD